MKTERGKERPGRETETEVKKRARQRQGRL
jgi:hypothetical protein